MFDALDEYDDGQVSREEFLASLDLDHPHLMAFLKATALAGAAIEAEGEAEAETGGGAGAESTGDHHRRRSGAAGGRRSTGGRRGVATVAVAVGPEALSVFDAIEANDDDFISWDEVHTYTHTSYLHLEMGEGAGRGEGDVCRSGSVASVRHVQILRYFIFGSLRRTTYLPFTNLLQLSLHQRWPHHVCLCYGA